MLCGRDVRSLFVNAFLDLWEKGFKVPRGQGVEVSREQTKDKKIKDLFFKPNIFNLLSFINRLVT